ncbi:MAG: hypothetical protein JXO22_12550, partial [Phycisphaerae bacterium]|nr:hypothetical protein [Phycisphaerae bacterium]
ERELTFDELRAADEVLLTNSLMEIMPVVRIEREPVGNECPGPMFLQLREAYEWLVRQECEGGEEEGE